MKMAPLTRQDLKWLTTPHPWPCLSIYLEIKRDGYHADAFLAQVSASAAIIDGQLKEKGLSAAVRSTFTSPLTSLDRLGLEALYRDYRGNRVRGLAFFMTPDAMLGYVHDDELPNLSAIRPHFELRPLLAATCENDEFYMLGASPAEVKLWHITSQNEGPPQCVELPEEVPKDEKSFLEHTEFSPKLAYHAMGAEAPGMTIGKWYGTVARDREDKMLDDYALAIARPISQIVSQRNCPLIVAAHGNMAVLLKKHLKVPLLVEDTIDVSPGHVPIQDLVLEGWQRIREIEKQKANGEIERYKKHLGTPRTASTIDDIWSAATRGQIDVLLASSKRDLPVDDERAELVSAAVQETLHRGGNVLLTEDPFLTDACPMGAILRWRA